MGIFDEDNLLAILSGIASLTAVTTPTGTAGGAGGRAVAPLLRRVERTPDVAQARKERNRNDGDHHDKPIGERAGSEDPDQQRCDDDKNTGDGVLHALEYKGGPRR